MSKVYTKEINCCNECPDNKVSSKKGTTDIIYLCLGKFKKDDTPRRLMNYCTIPKWCPLLDKKE